jgi:hypothetical protein
MKDALAGPLYDSRLRSVWRQHEPTGSAGAKLTAGRVTFLCAQNGVLKELSELLSSAS